MMLSSFRAVSTVAPSRSAATTGDICLRLIRLFFDPLGRPFGLPDMPDINRPLMDRFTAASIGGPRVEPAFTNLTTPYLFSALNLQMRLTPLIFVHCALGVA
jgi:hypothetical protein